MYAVIGQIGHDVAPSNSNMADSTSEEDDFTCGEDLDAEEEEEEDDDDSLRMGSDGYMFEPTAREDGQAPMLEKDANGRVAVTVLNGEFLLSISN